MGTKEIIESYFKALNEGGWESYVGEEIEFASSGQKTKGKAAYVDATKKFMEVAKKVDVKKLIVEGDDACALTQYQLARPGKKGSSDIAEILTVKEGKIVASTIFFDTASFRAFMAD
jgi:ketosteroid isomerase-like protein